MMGISYLFLSFIFLLFASAIAKKKYLNPISSKCELEGMTIASTLVDHYNSFDEDTEWDMRVHSDYLGLHLGFSPWIQLGTWPNTKKSSSKLDIMNLQKIGGWIGTGNVSQTSYRPLNDLWLYTMGDSTQRQIWASMLSPFQSADFESKAKEWTRENCARQYPHRKIHQSGGNFPDEGWGGKCGNNEVTCNMKGFGDNGKITFDWKHFPFEDYDAWLFGEDGLWKSNSSAKSYPDVLLIHVGLHTCVHGLEGHNDTLVANHKRDIPIMMNSIKTAINRTPTELLKTKVIIQLPGRGSYGNSRYMKCQRNFNRILTKYAHEAGFLIYDREEIERRLLFKSEFNLERKFMNPNMHMAQPCSQISGTAVLGIINCLFNENNHHHTFPR